VPAGSPALSQTVAGLGINHTNLGTCLYTYNGSSSSQTCSVRTWSFTVSARNAVGSGVASLSTGPIRPLVSYVGDNVFSIWPNNPVNAGTQHFGSCIGCHAGTNPLHLDGTVSNPNCNPKINPPPPCPAGANCNSFQSIYCSKLPVITSPFYLLLCPTGSTSCVCPAGTTCVTPLWKGTAPHPGGLLFPTGSPEYNTIQQWISDGALF